MREGKREVDSEGKRQFLTSLVHVAPHCCKEGGSWNDGKRSVGCVGRGKDMSNITGHRGKDISTILEEERKESKRPPRAAALRRKKRRRLNDLDSDSNLDEEESEDEFRISEG
ncbi:Remodeling and spacing factor 1, partial [Ophiophagus hannah]